MHALWEEERATFAKLCWDELVGVRFPGDANVDYLCLKCQQALAPELKKQQSEQDGGIKKPRERTYAGLNLPRSIITQEVKSYLEVNRFLDVETKEEENRTIITGGDLAVIINGPPDSVTVAAGPREVIDASQAVEGWRYQAHCSP